MMAGRAGPIHAGSLTALVERLLAVRGAPADFWRAFDESLVPMLVLDRERRIVEANHAARLLLRLRLDELRGVELDRFGTPDAALPARSDWDEVTRGVSTIGIATLWLEDGVRLSAVYRLAVGVVPGEYLLALSPADWSDDEWATLRHRVPISRSVPLSHREREVLMFAAEGLTASEVAAAMGIARSTVRTHLDHVMRKLGARNRAHAVALALQTRAGDPWQREPSWRREVGPPMDPSGST